LFRKIKEAQVPPKVTVDFIHTKLGLKSSSYRAMIPLLKRLGFIDDSSVPNAYYRDYRDETKSKIIMAQLVRNAYRDLFATSEYAYKLKREDVIAKLNTVLGTPADDKVTPKVAGTFMALCDLADFESQGIPEAVPIPEKVGLVPSLQQPATKLGISYTINLNLPPTTDIEVFNAIFKALRENLLK
jgi:hypothetical protein